MPTKITILSYDSFLRKGLQEITDSISVNGISCAGNILIIDLQSTPSGTALQVREFCHVIYIISEPATLPLLAGLEFKYDVYFLMRDVSVEHFVQTITDLVISIMQKKCYWAGVRRVQTNDDYYFSKLSSNETKFLELYKKGIGIKKLAELMNKASKTTYGYRSDVMFKLGIKSKIQLARVILQVELIKDIQIINDGFNKPEKVASERQVCRNVSGGRNEYALEIKWRSNRAC